MRYNLPNDLKKFTRKKLVGAVAFAVITVCVIVGIYVGLMAATAKISVLRRVIMSAAYVIVTAALVYVLKIWRRLTNGTYAGKVKKVSVNRGVESRSGGVGQGSRFVRRTVKILVFEPGGRTNWHVALSANTAGADVENLFREGDDVVHLRGTSIVNILGAKHVGCCVCGADNAISADFCQKCGHTLIKSVEMIKND